MTRKFTDKSDAGKFADYVVAGLVLTALALVVAALGVAMFGAPGADAATITVTPGQTIQSGINSAVPGDTVVVQPSARAESISLGKSITVRAETPGTVVLSPGGYTAISIQCSNCAVIGFTAQNFSQAISGTGRSNVTLQDLKFINAGAGIWIDKGNGWLVERVDLEFRCRDGEDYMNALSSTNMTFRRLYFHGLRIPSDLGTGTNLKHSDLLQTWVTGGATGLTNAVIEECIFTDFMEGVYLNNEAFTTNAVNNITVRNNVFWGTTLPASGNWLGSPSVSTQFTGPATGSMNIKNNIFRTYANGIRLYNQSAVGVEGNIFDGGGTTYSMGGSTTAASVKRGTLGNILRGGGWDGGVSGPPDKTNVDPQYQNVNSLLGPDGIPWTSDDGWRPMNAAAAAYGPQITLSGGAPANRAPVANPDAYSAIYGNAQFAQFAVLGNDTDPDGDPITVVSVGVPSKGGTAQVTSGGAAIQYRPAPTFFGTETFNYTISDGKGEAAVSNVTVTIPQPPDTAKPVITLLGLNPVNLTVGQVYVEAGATAVDDRDGDVSTKIVVSGSVNVAVAGNYSVKYDVRDAAGNAADQKVRSVVVSVAPPPGLTAKQVQDMIDASLVSVNARLDALEFTVTKSPNSLTAQIDAIARDVAQLKKDLADLPPAVTDQHILDLIVLNALLKKDWPGVGSVPTK